MAKVTFNSGIKQVSGKIGGWTYRGRGKGQSTISEAPDPPTKKRKISTAESETRLRTLRANAYSKSLTGNPELRARYVAVARARGAPLFAVSNRDFNNPPVIDGIDAAAYRGQAGQLIRIRAHDDFEVCEVTVKICTRAGTVLEAGAAVRGHDDTWQYVEPRPCLARAVRQHGS